ncbi:MULTISPECIES: hypothetical protein [unclassified Natrinema]|uniref:hypothetical protein n=1 Tax=unclassified Natrinema TaxID=2622230 RepID=UPI000677C439|nr:MULTISPECIES: hypothetical protein [unclassified Natrinema]
MIEDLFSDNEGIDWEGVEEAAESEMGELIEYHEKGNIDSACQDSRGLRMKVDTLQQWVSTLVVSTEQEMVTDTAATYPVKLEILESIFRAIVTAMTGVAAVGFALSLIAGTVSFALFFAVELLFFGYARRSVPKLFSNE